MKPKVLVWDIETTFNVGMFFQLFKQDINYKTIIQESFMVCASWRWLGQKRIHSVSVLDNKSRFKKDHADDYHVVKTLHKLLSQADAVIAHNGDRFDMKYFKGRCLYHRLGPIPPIIQIDTLKIARRHFRVNSNRLDYLARLLGYKGKLDNPENLWKECTLGKPSAIRHMVKYNKVDIDILEFVYNELLAYSDTQLNQNIFLGTECNCPACGSEHVQSRGTRKTKTTEYKQFQCQSCQKWFSKPRNSIAR